MVDSFGCSSYMFMPSMDNFFSFIQYSYLFFLLDLITLVRTSSKSKEELKNLLMKVKEESGKVGLKLQFSSVTQSCLSLYDPMDWSIPGLPIHHQLPEFTQTQSIESVMPPTISFSVIPVSSHLQSCPASGFFQMSQFFASGGQSIGVSASASIL